MAFVYDPLSSAFPQDRAGLYRRMRDEAPVYVDPDNRFVALSRFDDVQAAAADWERFSAVTAEAKILRPIINDMDPPLHGQRRGNLARAFTPTRVADLESRVRSIARSLIVGFSRVGSCDLIAEFAAPFPARVMGELLGVPETSLATCHRITDAVMRIEGPDGNASPVELADDLFGPLIAERREHPRDDLISALLAVGRGGGEPLSEEEILGFCYLLLIGGNDTTTNLIGNGMELLARHPQQRTALVDDPELIPQAVEEMLRVEPPTQVSARQSTREIPLHGETIPADIRVLLLWGAANLDEREFTRPDDFDIQRPRDRHLSFGYGAHFCMGTALARLEARVAFEELLSCLPTFEITQRPERIRSSWAWGFESLHMTFRPSR